MGNLREEPIFELEVDGATIEAHPYWMLKEFGVKEVGGWKYVGRILSAGPQTQFFGLVALKPDAPWKKIKRFTKSVSGQYMMDFVDKRFLYLTGEMNIGLADDGWINPVGVRCFPCISCKGEKVFVPVSNIKHMKPWRWLIPVQ